MKKRYAFIFDLDGTLLTSQLEISERSLIAIHKTIEKGHEIIIATARPPRSAQHFVNHIATNISSVFYNGGMYNSAKGTHRSFSISQNTFEEIVQLTEKHDKKAYISIEAEDQWYTHNSFDYAHYFNIAKGPMRINRKELLTFSPTKILIINSANKALIQEQFATRCNCIITDNNTLLQIMPIEASKEKAVSSILAELHLTFEDAVCFGDDNNDIGLFKQCGLSVAPNNAIKEIKDIATVISDSNNNDGIAMFLEEFLSL